MQISGKVSLTVGWLTLFVMGTELFVISPLLPFISEAYKVSSSEAGWMVSVFAVTYAATAPFFGWLSDRKGRRNLIASGLLLFMISNALTACAPTFPWLLVSRILAGMSVASITPLIYAAVGDVAPYNRRGSWLSIALMGYAAFTSYQARLAIEYSAGRGAVMAWNNTALYVGITLGATLGGFVISNWGYRTLPFVCGGIAMISLILSIRRPQI